MNVKRQGAPSRALNKNRWQLELNTSASPILSPTISPDPPPKSVGHRPSALILVLTALRATRINLRQWQSQGVAGGRPRNTVLRTSVRVLHLEVILAGFLATLMVYSSKL